MYRYTPLSVIITMYCPKSDSGRKSGEGNKTDGVNISAKPTMRVEDAAASSVFMYCLLSGD